MPLYTATPSTPLGPLRLVSDGNALVSASFGGSPDAALHDGGCPVLARACRLLADYFAGSPVPFSVPIRLEGTPFQVRVWRALCAIPHGETVAYGALAERLGGADAAQAVGTACGRNPLLVVVPCHRVVGADGALTGYAGGVARKRALLALERRQRSLFG